MPKTFTVNDIHSQLNETRVYRIETPKSIKNIQQIVRQASKEGRAISIAGGRHAMGGQQFGEATIHIDMRQMCTVVNFDKEKGEICVEAGIEWPELMGYLRNAQKDEQKPWAIRQKQTGADTLTIGGSISANAHGRGLSMPPIIGDVESFLLVDANGDAKICNRTQNEKLFALVIGGYGLFGVIAEVTLRLTPRHRVQRVVEVADVKNLMNAFEKRIKDGFLYGDCQFSTDETSEYFLLRGVFSCYKPVADSVPIPGEQKKLSKEDWQKFYFLARNDRPKAYQAYMQYYLSTNGQIYDSDTHQLSTYVDGYAQEIQKILAEEVLKTEMITEIYVPREKLYEFMKQTADDFRKNNVQVFYGTIRLIEKDLESFLPWAKESYACVIFNLTVTHSPEGKQHTADAFRRLIDCAIGMDGNYFPTYHRYARRDQVEACYPQFVDFLKLKKKYDPEERFQSEWYRHYRTMFNDVL